MNLFLKRILFLFVPIAFILCIGEYAIRQIPNSFKVKTEYLRENSSEIETLILGSSHTYYGVNPIFIKSKAFNASNISQSPDVDFAILKSYEDVLNNLKTVIIRLSYDTLFEQLKDSPEDWRLKDYKIYTDVDFDYSLKHNSEILSIGTKQVIKTLKTYYFDKKPLLNCNSLGWGNDLSDRPKTDLEKVGVIAAKRHTIEQWDLLEANISVYKQLNAWCEKRGVKVILVTPPAYISYRGNLNPVQYNEMIKVGNMLESEFDNCVYYNFMAHPDFMTSDFYDPDHLNVEGAKKFSLILNDLIEN